MRAIGLLLLAIALATPTTAMADEADASADVSFGVDDGMFELGIYWGLFLPETAHEFYEVDTALPRAGHQKLQDVNLDFGLRLGYLPWQWGGLEIEGGLIPTKVESGDSGLIMALRAHAILMAPTEGLVPFVVLGGGLMNMGSDRSAVGDDTDGAIHWGLGAKGYMTRDVAVRLDIRDNIMNGRGTDESAHNWEALLGLSVALGRPDEQPPAPADTDGDGFTDDVDACPTEAGVDPDGCPVRDADGDGVLDDADACPTEAGVASEDPKLNGCAPPPADGDGDGVPDEKDACPAIAAKTADGCPPDSDNDGIRDDKDKCPTEAETKNGYKDKDGCPDEIPQEVKEFTGVIKGIYFDVNKATIQKKSFKHLDKAAKVLTKFTELRVEVSGHTDNTGTKKRNTELSKERAEAVKAYLVEKGVGEGRIETRGAGPDQPIEDNATKTGRAKNRRIEFKVLKDEAPAAAAPATEQPAPAKAEPAPPAAEAKPAAEVKPAAAAKAAAETKPAAAAKPAK